MLKRYHEGFSFLFRTIDVLVVIASWFFSYWLRFHSGLVAAPKGVPEFSGYAALVPLIVFLWLALFEWQNVYESSRMLKTSRALGATFKAHLVTLLAFVAATFMLEEYRYSRGVILYFGGVSTIALLAFRATVLHALRSLRARGYNVRHIIAIGEGAALETVISRLEAYPELGLRIRGVVTGDRSSRRDVAGYPALGHFGTISKVIQEHRPDEVLVALPAALSAEMDLLLRRLKDETVHVRIVPDLNTYAALGCNIENFDGMPVLNLNDSPVVGFGGWAKRFTDFSLAIVGIILLSPLLLLIALLVKLSSPGPILYAQERLGLDGQSFKMLKFRSMAIDAEAQSGPVWAKKDDNRRTAFGTFLRKTSLDELPQLWNVVRGEMSLVGPRPERPVFVNNFRHEIPNYMLRHKVRAGITGWAQVNGWRGDTSLERRIECDLFYIRNWSYLLDLKILTMTLWKGFVNKNAY
ncbi:MAG: undecaprenyl-phosphate glucose phosphotransferase [Sorangiineae bacterium NIC37A_2]|nr:MAG: undecaprenyl-phosphate glucose phosphotransferase [Sorangiineae bacterium NIC37A_2]